MGQAVKQRVPNQVDAFLAVQSPDRRHDGLELLGQQEPVPQRPLVGVLAVEPLTAVLLRDQVIDLRVPHVVVDAVEHATELVGMHVQRVAKSLTLLGVPRLPSVLRRHSRMISTAWPRISSSRLSPNTTSPNAPACATGAHSEATMITNITQPQPARWLGSGRPARPRCSRSRSTSAKQRHLAAAPAEIRGKGRQRRDSWESDRSAMPRAPATLHRRRRCGAARQTARSGCRAPAGTARSRRSRPQEPLIIEV